MLEMRQRDSCRTLQEFFQKGLGQLRDVCGFEDIEQSQELQLL